jgi:hypothetical protein
MANNCPQCLGNTFEPDADNFGDGACSNCGYAVVNGRVELPSGRMDTLIADNNGDGKKD